MQRRGGDQEDEARIVMHRESQSQDNGLHQGESTSSQDGMTSSADSFPQPTEVDVNMVDTSAKEIHNNEEVGMEY